MRKWTLVAAGAVGFLLGSRAGRGPYEQVERQIRRVGHHPDVRKVTDQVGESAAQVSDAATSAMSSMAEQTSDAVNQAGRQVADSVSGTTGQVADQAADSIQQAGDRAADKLNP